MESVQFYNFGKVEKNSRDNGQKSQTGEDTFSDIMEQSLGQVHKEEEPKEEQKKEDKPEGIVVPAQMLIFPNQVPTAEEPAASGTGQIQALAETESLQTTMEQPADMAGLEQPANPMDMTDPEQPVDLMENPMDPAAVQTDGEHLQTADTTAGLTKTEQHSEKFQLQSPEASPSEPEAQRGSEGVKTEAKVEVRSEEHEPKELLKETAKEGMAVHKDREDERKQTSEAVEAVDREGIQNPVNALDGKKETVSHETVQVHVSQPEELPQELAKELAVKAAAGQNEFEIQITPKHLGEIVVRVMQKDGVSVVSIVCSEKKTMELLAQSAREIGSVMEQNLGKPTEIYVEKQENENPWQEQRENDHAGRESEQDRQREQNEKMKAAKSARFLQELRLGLMR